MRNVGRPKMPDDMPKGEWPLREYIALDIFLSFSLWDKSEWTKIRPDERKRYRRAASKVIRTIKKFGIL